MKKLEDFQRLKGTFDTEVLRVYDSKLSGNYFLHQFEPNRGDEGIDYDTGGRELALNGAKLIVPAVNLFASDITGLYPKIEKEYYEALSSETGDREGLSGETRMISGLEGGVKYLSDERYHLSPHSYLDVYPAIIHFSEQTPQEYRQGLGEMIFHQLRLLNMCHLGESDPFQFHSLDRILQLIPDKDFLSKERILQLGEGLVREVLKSKDGCRNSAEAKQAIERYGLQDDRLIAVVTDMENRESEHKARMNKIQRELKKEREAYRTTRRAILSTIDEDMHTYDYRD